MSQATSQDYVFAKASHGKLDALKTRMHGYSDMHGVPYGCSKAQGCLPSDTHAYGLRCGIDDIVAMP